MSLDIARCVEGGRAGLDLWLCENPLEFVWLGSYLVAFVIFAVEIYSVINKRKQVLQRVRLLRDVGDEE
jgi:hypothetical protein